MLKNLKVNKKIIGLLLCFLSFAVNVSIAQVIPINKSEISAQLKEKGITEQELNAKLEEKGVDFSRINPSDPAQVAQAKKDVDEAIAELEKEKTSAEPAQSNSDTVIIDNPREVKENNQTIISEADQAKVIQENQEEIQKAIEEGATEEEAIAEAISDELEAQLPPATTWGQQVFRDKKISVYQQSRDTKPPLSYILGPGDRVAVSIWGYSQENVVLKLMKMGILNQSECLGFI